MSRIAVNEGIQIHKHINGDLPQVFVDEGKNYKFEIPV